MRKEEFMVVPQGQALQRKNGVMRRFTESEPVKLKDVKELLTELPFDPDLLVVRRSLRLRARAQNRKGLEKKLNDQSKQLSDKKRSTLFSHIVHLEQIDANEHVGNTSEREMATQFRRRAKSFFKKVRSDL